MSDRNDARRQARLELEETAFRLVPQEDPKRAAREAAREEAKERERLEAMLKKQGALFSYRSNPDANGERWVTFCAHRNPCGRGRPRGCPAPRRVRIDAKGKIVGGQIPRAAIGAHVRDVGPALREARAIERAEKEAVQAEHDPPAGKKFRTSREAWAAFTKANGTNRLEGCGVPVSLVRVAGQDPVKARRRLLDHLAGEFDAINERTGRRGYKKIATLEEAFTAILPRSRAWADIDVRPLNDISSCGNLGLLPPEPTFDEQTKRELGAEAARAAADDLEARAAARRKERAGVHRDRFETLMRVRDLVLAYRDAGELNKMQAQAFLSDLWAARCGDVGRLLDIEARILDAGGATEFRTNPGGSTMAKMRKGSAEAKAWGARMRAARSRKHGGGGGGGHRKSRGRARSASHGARTHVYRPNAPARSSGGKHGGMTAGKRLAVLGFGAAVGATASALGMAYVADKEKRDYAARPTGTPPGPKPSGMGYGVGAVPAVVGAGLALKKSPGAKTFGAGLAIGSGVVVGAKVAKWELAPKVFDRETLTRLFPDVAAALPATTAPGTTPALTTPGTTSGVGNGLPDGIWRTRNGVVSEFQPVAGVGARPSWDPTVQSRVSASMAPGYTRGVATLGAPRMIPWPGMPRVSMASGYTR